HLKLVRAAMAGVVNDIDGGTAFRSRIREEGFEMAGKTGTAQVRRISKAERDTGVRKNEELPYLMRDHSLFVGYAPLHNPRFAASVVVEHGGSGSKVAAPICSAILLKAQERFKEMGEGLPVADGPQDRPSGANPDGGV
ncbi:MAG: penicillin-binding transpeptidase domain-containing protein, partial [Rhodospirillales bacterium]